MEERKSELITDQPPTKEDLVGLCSQMYSEDPRSIFYNRQCERPKLGGGRVCLHLMFILLAMTGIGVVTWFITNKTWLSIALPWVAVTVYAVVRLKAFLIFLVKLYQKIAPISIRKRCRFEPSCSQYMLLSIEKYGARKGFAKGFRRWCNCKPPNGGFDWP